MKNFEITYTTDNKIFSAVRVVAETAEQAQAYYTAQADECDRSINIVGCQETTAAVKPSQSVLTVPEGWEPQRTDEEITADIIAIFNDDEELFNDCIEELDGYNGYLGDNRLGREYEQDAKEFCEAVKTIAEKPENLENLELYLSIHFQKWLDRFANYPESITAELKHFAGMDA